MMQRYSLLLFGLWVSGCTTNSVEKCPDGQAMAANGKCMDVASDSSAATDDETQTVSPTDPRNDSPTEPRNDSGEPADVLSTEGLDRVQNIFPTAVGMRLGDIPDALNMPGDVELGNITIQRVLDETGETLGFTRHIFTPVYCAAGVCAAIRFVMTFTPEYRPLAVYHPNGFEYRLMKYFDGYYEPFNEEDWALLNSVFSDPPEAYLPVESVEEMVDGTYGTAPTLPEFQPITVRGAVFTIWYIVRYGQQTEQILTNMEVENALP